MGDNRWSSPYEFRKVDGVWQRRTICPGRRAGPWLTQVVVWEHITIQARTDRQGKIHYITKPKQMIGWE